MSRFVIGLLLFGLPASALTLRLWIERRKDSDESTWSDIPRQIAVFVNASWLLCWIGLALNLLHPWPQWTGGFFLAWPLFGLLLSVINLVLSFFAGRGEKVILCIANFLFLCLSVSSMIYPN
jgi:hypothetical protein